MMMGKKAIDRSVSIIIARFWPEIMASTARLLRI